MRRNDRLARRLKRCLVQVEVAAARGAARSHPLLRPPPPFCDGFAAIVFTFAFFGLRASLFDLC